LVIPKGEKTPNSPPPGGSYGNTHLIRDNPCNPWISFLIGGAKRKPGWLFRKEKNTHSPPPGGSQGKPATKSEEIDISRIGFLNLWINTLPAIT